MVAERHKFGAHRKNSWWAFKGRLKWFVWCSRLPSTFWEWIATKWLKINQEDLTDQRTPRRTSLAARARRRRLDHGRHTPNKSSLPRRVVSSEL